MERKVGENEPNIVKVKPAANKLVYRNEKVEYEVITAFYTDLVHDKKKLKKVERLQYVGKVIFPIFIHFVLYICIEIK